MLPFPTYLNSSISTNKIPVFLFSNIFWPLFHTLPLVVTQDYQTYVNQAHVIRGNDVLFKCDIPSFVADLLTITAWADNQGNVILGGLGKTWRFCMGLLD